ncbi:MAG: imidazoleglycerol-phosphate dehydratase HisB [Desulfatitalea sp.]|nr:imidazoleglycerol-phosphate dehydratase HisB [Desulfatitalea sp.]NNJ99405.1 imidazoleglycerol-phosphate dehydratase HisB [Desulfatitalea sp.]
MKRIAEIERRTNETRIRTRLNLDGVGKPDVTTGIGFFDHMLTLLSVHSVMDLTVEAHGDVEVDFHHTVEDVGLVIGQAINAALGDRKGIWRYGHAVIPMDDALAQVTVDLSNRPFFKIELPTPLPRQNDFDASLANEFFRAFTNKGGMNLHVRVLYGDNWHHMIEAVFKGMGRALRKAVAFDNRVVGIPSSKGTL